MRETGMTDILNHKKQAHARMCEGNNLELELEEIKNACWYYCVVNCVSLKEHIHRKSGGMYQDHIVKNNYCTKLSINAF